MVGKKRRQELEYYVKNDSGQYVYVGPRYRYAGKTPRKKNLALLWALTAGALAVTIVCGFLPAPGMAVCWYVVVPYVLSLVLSMTALMALGKMTGEGDAIRAYVYETAWTRLPLRCVLTGILAAVAAVGHIVWSIRWGLGKQAAAAVAYIVLMAVVCALQFLAKKVTGRMPWEEPEEDAEKDGMPDDAGDRDP